MSTKTTPTTTLKTYCSSTLIDSTTEWERWVPMKPKLYDGVQLMNLCMLQKVDEMFTEAKIKYWICGGNLMGAIRHSGLIPHDDDIDIEIFENDLELVRKLPLCPPLYTNFIERAGQWEGHRVSKLKFFHDQFEIDIFPRRLQPEDHDSGGNDDVVADDSNTSPNYVNLTVMRNFPSHDEIFPLKRYDFHNIQVWGPGGCPDSYLNRCYGKDWKDTVCVWNHDYNNYHTKAFDKRKVVLPLEVYNKIVSEAGICPPQAKATADLTFRKLCREYNSNNDNTVGDGGVAEEDKDHPFLKDYEKYRTQRTWRWNRSDAEWRDQKQQQEEQNEDE
mmetsp:Transcript_17454/g.42429  ORF Transcript_17454/g.42429 Transcript_17454/m.42429 type:complete len:331 (+) Transcript_17454:78-1070(+)